MRRIPKTVLTPSSPETELEVLRVFRSRKEAKAFYNKISSVYDLLSDRSEGPVRQAGLEMLDAQKGERVLEIGFGTGHSLVALADAVGPTGKVHGLDLSDRMLALAEENLRRKGFLGRTELVCGDAAKLPYPADSLGGVFMSFTLELFDTTEIPKILNECKRVLQPGGRIVVVGMTKKDAKGPVVRMFEWTHRHFPNFVDCRPIFVRRAVEEAGFEVKRDIRKNMWVPVAIVLGIKPL